VSKAQSYKQHDTTTRETQMKQILLSLVFSILAFGQISAQPEPGSGFPPGRGLGFRQLQRLDLTDAQRKQVDELQMNHQKKMIQNKAKIDESRVDLRSAMRAETPDRSAVEKALRSVSEQQLQAKLERTKFWFDVRGVLTPEQQKRWKRIPEMARGRRHEDSRARGCGSRCGRHGQGR
jgi:Spy/CpxP family protein refolding chaperone